MKKLAIIGGGFSGSKIAKTLENEFDVTLIDTKDYFEFKPGIFLAITNHEKVNRLRIPHRKYLEKTKVIRGSVTKISDDYVVSDNKKIKFDYLVIATGSKYNIPFRDNDIILTNMANRLEKHQNDLNRAKTILVVGGGFTGVELVSDIVSEYPKKKIILVHSMKRLLERQPKKAGELSEKFLKKKGVDIIFNEFALGKRGKEYFTNKGTKIKADVSFLCVGICPNSDFMKKSFQI